MKFPLQWRIRFDVSDPENDLGLGMLNEIMHPWSFMTLDRLPKAQTAPSLQIVSVWDPQGRNDVTASLPKGTKT